MNDPTSDEEVREAVKSAITFNNNLVCNAVLYRYKNNLVLLVGGRTIVVSYGTAKRGDSRQ